MHSHNNAGFTRRAIAQIIDTLLLMFVWLIPIYFLAGNISNYELVDPLKPFVNILTFVLLALFLGTILHTVYVVYFYEMFGGTIGKLLCGLKVVDQDTNKYLDKKTALYRVYAGYSFSGGFLGLGYFMVIKSDQNLAWHDELFNTKVIKSSSIIPGIISLVIMLGILYVTGSSIFQNLSNSKTIKNIIDATENVDISNEDDVTLDELMEPTPLN